MAVGLASRMRSCSWLWIPSLFVLTAKRSRHFRLLPAVTLYIDIAKCQSNEYLQRVMQQHKDPSRKEFMGAYCCERLNRQTNGASCGSPPIL